MKSGPGMRSSPGMISSPGMTRRRSGHVPQFFCTAAALAVMLSYSFRHSEGAIFLTESLRAAGSPVDARFNCASDGRLAGRAFRGCLALRRSLATIFGLGVLGLLCGSLSGCGLTSGESTVAMRVVNAVSTSSLLDVDFAGSTFVSAMNFTGVSNYSFVAQGSNDFEGLLSGTTTVMVPDQTLNLQTGIYTIACAGDPASTNSATKPAWYTYTDTNTVAPAGKISVRVINLSPDPIASPRSIDVSFGSQTIVTALPYGWASPYVTLDAGDYNVTATGTGGGPTVATKTSLPFGGASVYTIFVAGEVGTNAVIIPQRDI